MKVPVFLSVCLTVIFLHTNKHQITLLAGPRSAVGSPSYSRARSPGFDTRSGYILSFLLPLTQEGQLSVAGESMCTKKLIKRLGGLSLPLRKSVVRLTDHPSMTIHCKKYS